MSPYDPVNCNMHSFMLVWFSVANLLLWVEHGRPGDSYHEADDHLAQLQLSEFSSRLYIIYNSVIAAERDIQQGDI